MKNIEPTLYVKKLLLTPMLKVRVSNYEHFWNAQWNDRQFDYCKRKVFFEVKKK